MSKSLNAVTYGDDMQAIEIALEPKQAVRSEAGSMLYMETGVEMQTNMEGGLLKGIKRAVTGESFFITSFTNSSDTARKVAFAAPYPGKIMSLELSTVGNRYFCQRDSFLCSDSNVEVEIALTKRLGAGFFGGEGFILQKLMGDGQAFIHAGGTTIERDLAEGEVIKVDTGCLVAFSSSVNYDIQVVGGFKNMLFGGEGLFLATLTGPGHVILQTLPFSRMAARIVAASGMSGGGAGEARGVAGVGGSIFKAVISGN